MLLALILFPPHENQHPQGEVLYVHCWGGHGRAGTVAACLMAILDGLDPREALANTQKYHDTRLEVRTADARTRTRTPPHI